jgi:hypothetical protein
MTDGAATENRADVVSARGALFDCVNPGTAETVENAIAHANGALFPAFHMMQLDGASCRAVARASSHSH